MNYDAIIIGSGQGGNPLAQRLASDGKRVALVESALLGGTCVNTGCTPTKAMIASAQVAHYARNAKKWGVYASNVGVDLSAILHRKDEIVEQSRNSWEKRFEAKDNPCLYRGRARFTAPKQIQVDDTTLIGDHVFIDTGARPALPAIPGLDTVDYLTYVSILQQREFPEHLVVLGGGPVGLEFGQMFRRFGSEITIIQRAPRILPNEDEDISEELMHALESEGIRFLLGMQATQITRHRTHIGLTAKSHNRTEEISGSHILVATGRIPNTEDLDLNRAGIKTDEKGFILVDDQLKTTAEGVWALGDVKGGPQFTHISYNDYQIVYANVYEGKALSTQSRIVPYAVFTDPALGRVGQTERAARAQGRKLKIGKVAMTRVARAIERGETAGLMKLVADATSDRILGASILSSEGGELIQILSTLMLAENPYTSLKGAIYIHPTLAEGLFSLMDSVQPVD